MGRDPSSSKKDTLKHVAKDEKDDSMSSSESDHFVDDQPSTSRQTPRRTGNFVTLQQLSDVTKFPKEDIRRIYRGFKQTTLGLTTRVVDKNGTTYLRLNRTGKLYKECPEGVVLPDALKEVYQKFFPCGNAALYALHVFRTFDPHKTGAISFEDMLVSLSTLLRGSVYEKLIWSFKLYDLNSDGILTRTELTDIVSSVHDIMGKRPHHQAEDERKIKEHVDYLFEKMDLNKDGVITLEEFMEACLRDEAITKSMEDFGFCDFT